MWRVVICCVVLLCGVTGQLTETSSGGFLADVIPLEVVTTTPTALTREERVSITGQQAITAVFSRPVIALGSDFGFEELPEELVPFTFEPAIPGRGRWVTTFIYRFDSDGPFATDLSIEFLWNLNLLTYDGVPLSLESAESVTLTTDGLIMDILDVKSALARNATDGRWNTFDGLEDDILPEVPPDGFIELLFNAPVSLTVLEENLQVRDVTNDELTDITVRVEPCEHQEPEDGETRCANVTLDGDLEIDTEYSLFLEAGVDYGNASGPLREDVSLTFGGLRRFRFPFIEYENIYSTPFLDIYLPHGLAEGTELDDIPIELTDEDGPLEFELTQVDKSQLRLIADLQPRGRYSLSVESSEEILDGFGLSLEASDLTFTTSEIFSDFEMLQSGHYPHYAVFEENQFWGRRVLGFAKGSAEEDSGLCRQGSVIDIWSVDEPESAIPIFTGSARRSFERFLGEPDDQLVADRLDPIAELVSRNVSSILAPTGVMAFQFCRYRQHRPEIFLETSVQVTVMSHDQMEQSQEVAVWVTSMETGAPVQNAEVSLYGDDYPSSNPTFLGDGITNADGLAYVDAIEDMDLLIAVVRIGANFVYVPDVTIGQVQLRSYQDTMVLDRALVRPGETLHVKGYVKQREGRALVPPTGFSRPVLIVSPPLVDTDRFPVQLDEEFGSYEAEIEIPEDADLVPYSISFRGVRPDRRPQRTPLYFGAAQSFTVGDPRLPTVALTVDTPSWVEPTGRVRIQVNIESFIGSAVGDQEVSVNWRIEESRDIDAEPVEGELTITTDDTGNGRGVIDLSELESPPSVGSTLSIDLQYVGPTSELIEESASVRIEAADVELTLSRTVATEIPGHRFGVLMSGTDLEGSPLETTRRTRTSISLIELPEDSEEDLPTTSTTPLDGPIITSCDVELDEEDYCDMALPSAGKFAIEGCLVQGAVQICERIFLGRTLEDWEEHPLERFPSIGFTDTTQERLQLGEAKRILIDNPYEQAHALITYGTIERTVQFVAVLPVGRRFAAVDVTEMCEFGCGLSIVVAVPRQTGGLATNISIPVSRLFDPAQPHTETYRTNIDVIPSEPTEIDVSVSFPEAFEDEGVSVVAPGETTTIDVELDTERRTEVTLIAVDRAVLDLLPYALANLSTSFVLNLGTRFRETSLSQFIISPNAIQALIDTFNSRRELDPWFNLVSSLGDTYNVDQTEEEYIEYNSDYITIQSFGIEFETRNSAESLGLGGVGEEFGILYSMPTADLPATARSAPGESAVTAETASARISARAEFGEDESASAEFAAMGEASTLRLESEFVSTPLFQTQIARDGRLEATFTAPSNLGTFVIRAYAASIDGIFGSTESEIIVRRDLSLTPSVPRFARVGDIFEAGAVVTVSGSTDTAVTLSAQIEGPLEIIGDDILDADVGADGQVAARFTLRALAVGVANLTLITEDEQGNEDALQLEIEIQGLQESVTVGTSFTVEGSDLQSFVEGIDLPDAVPGSGDILITAGVGRQPAVLALADQILEVKAPFECPVDADFALATVAIPAIVDSYDPWNLETLSEDLVELLELMLERFEEGSELLFLGGGLTTRREGLRRVLPCPEDDRDRDPSFYQNAKGVFLLNLVESNLLNHSLRAVRAAAEDLIRAGDIWRTQAGSELERLAIEARERPLSLALSASTVAFGRAALGADWQPETTNTTILEDLSMDRLSRVFNELSIESQAYYILARLESDAAHPDITTAVQSWIDLLRITGRTAYISAFPGATSPASDLGNALVFLSMLRAGEEGQLLPRLASYIASPPADFFGFRVFGTFPKLVTMQALMEYDVSRGSAQPDLEFEAISGNVSLLAASFTNASTPVTSSRVVWEDLPEEPEPIVVSALGDGEASVSITLNFVPAEILPFPTYRGIFVERSIQLEDSEDGDGPGLSVVPQGSVVTVKVQFLTPDDLGETVVRVLMPAGLEPVDPNIAGGLPICPVPFFDLYSSFIFFRCPVQRTAPEIVSFTFDSVRSGTNSVSFRAVAATAGVFTLPPTRVFATDQPEVMGLSSAGEFEVCSGAACNVTFVEPANVPISCPDNCNGNGYCNLRDGACICFTGFAGESCDTPVET